MRKAILILIFSVVSISYAVSQDVITLKTGKEINCKIIHLNTLDVLFMPEKSSDTISILRNEAAILKYQGNIIVYLSNNEAPSVVTEFTGSETDSLYVLGKTDANKYYKGYKPAAIGTLVSSFFVPFGLIPAIACSSTPPVNNLGIRNERLMRSKEYYAGYTDEAFRIKKKKVWTNFGIGTGATVAYYLIIVTLISTMLAY